MNVLICNDDGIESIGLRTLAMRLAEKNNVLVIAPDGNRSACGHALTISDKTVKVQEYSGIKNCKAYSISGTPVDCVKVAKHLFPEFKADVVVSGINKGHNLGPDIMYSGTVSIAYESAFFGNVAFAFSAYSHGESDFETFSAYAEKIIEKLLPCSKSSTIWNVNFPNSDVKIKGVRFAKLGTVVYKDEYIKTSENEYRLIGSEDETLCNDEYSDIVLNKRGYITITPIVYDKTDYGKLGETKDLCIKL